MTEQISKTYTTDSPRKVVFYERVITDEAARLRLELNNPDWQNDQKKLHPHWTIVGSFSDSGFPGERSKTRFEFHKMVDLAPQGQFDLIVAHDVIEFATFASESFKVAKELADIGVEIYFVTENIWTLDPTGMRMLEYMASLSEEKAKVRSQRIKAGQKASREKGVLYGSGNILGYRRTPDGTYKIDDEQAETVRMIFNMYIYKRLGAVQIAREMEKLERKTATGLTKWRADTILSILGNSTYTGTQSGSLSSDEPGRLGYNGRKSDFYPIISRELFDRASRIRSERIIVDTTDGQVQIKSIRKSPRQLWSRKLVGENGDYYTRGTWTKNSNGETVEFGYFQNGRRDANSPAISVPEWRLEEMGKVFESYISDNLYDVALAIQKNIESKLSCKELERQRAEKIPKLKNRLETLLEMRIDGEISVDEYTEFKTRTEKEIQELETFNPAASEGVVDNGAVSKLMHQIDITLKNSASIHDAIDSLVTVIVPKDKSHFEWHVAMNDGEAILQIVSEGRKNESQTSVSGIKN